MYFYPRDNTPGCTIEAIDFSKDKEDFSKANTVILGVSKDNLVDLEGKSLIHMMKNLEIERFKIDENHKEKLINIISLARDSMHEPIPPKLTGSDAIKCEFCYKRKTCFGISDNEEIL